MSGKRPLRPLFWKPKEAPPPLPPDVAIRVRGLTKVYKLYESPLDRLKEAVNPFGGRRHRIFHALENISFEIHKGETVGIIGRNGSGKSTLLKNITGVSTPTAGTLEVEGKVSALLELGTGFNPELTGVENVYFSGTLAGYTREEMEARVDDILGFADIGEYVHQPIKTYSSGMYVRLAFAVAINVEPEILVLDEVLAVGDIAFQNKCLHVISNLAESGDTTILFVTHDINALRLLCGRVLLLEQGRLRLDGPPGKAIDRYASLVFGKALAPGSRVLTAGVLDRSGAFVEDIECRGEYSLAIDLREIRVEKGLLLAFRFVNLENKFSYRMETDAFRELAGTIRNRRLKASFAELNLPKGHYGVNISISDGSYLKRIHHFDEAVRFSVLESVAAPKTFLRAEWSEGEWRDGRIGLIGWWGGENEGDRYMLEAMGRTLGDRFDVHAIKTPFHINEASLDRLNSMDFLIVGGGGLFTNTPPVPFDTFPQWRERLKTPIGFLGVGIQGLDLAFEGVMKEIVDSSTVFVVRDTESYELVRRLSPKVTKAPDVTFLSPRTVSGREMASSTGVNLRVWNFDEKRTYDNAAWTAAINALPGEKLTIPLSSAEDLDDSRAMRGIVGRRNPVFDMRLYEEVRIMIGMRLHSLIFAAQNGIPIIGIAYAPKVRRFMRDAGLEEFCLDVAEYGRLSEAFDEALRRRGEISDILLGYTRTATRDIRRAVDELRLGIPATGSVDTGGRISDR